VPPVGLGKGMSAPGRAREGELVPLAGLGKGMVRLG